jgi:8-oxo-dGTP pyrophosphatase MutT (NUDIX family)
MDESYLENIIKETEEEIGITWISPIPGPKTQMTSWYLHFVQWFTLVIDLPIEAFILQADEVEWVRWISPENLRKEFSETPDNFVPSFALILPLFL